MLLQAVPPISQIRLIPKDKRKCNHNMYSTSLIKSLDPLIKLQETVFHNAGPVPWQTLGFMIPFILLLTQNLIFTENTGHV